MKYYLITFSSTHAAMAAQKFLKGKIPFYVMPTLREISNSCGISLKINGSAYEEIMEAMRDIPINDGMYKIYLITSSEIKEMD